MRDVPVPIDYRGEAFTPAWVADFLPRALSPGWRLLEISIDGAALRDATGLVVIVSGATEADGRRWWHVSLSRKDRLPTYDDQKTIKRLFIGDGREAYSIWPRAARHIAIHDYCLHLWCPVDGAVLPDFARGGRSI
jgi:hypothetical protein